MANDIDILTGRLDAVQSILNWTLRRLNEKGVLSDTDLNDIFNDAQTATEVMIQRFPDRDSLQVTLKQLELISRAVGKTQPEG